MNISLPMLSLMQNLTKFILLWFIAYMNYADTDVLGQYTYALTLVSPIFLMSGLKGRQLIIFENNAKHTFENTLPLVGLLGIFCLFLVSSKYAHNESYRIIILVAVLKYIETLVEMILGNLQKSGNTHHIRLYYICTTFIALALYSLLVVIELEEVLLLEVLLLAFVVIFKLRKYPLQFVQHAFGVENICVKFGALPLPLAGFCAGFIATVIVSFATQHLSSEEVFYLSKIFVLGAFTNRIISNFILLNYSSKENFTRSTSLLAYIIFCIVILCIFHFLFHNYGIYDGCFYILGLVIFFSNLMSQLERQIIISNAKYLTVMIFNLVELTIVFIMCWYTEQLALVLSGLLILRLCRASCSYMLLGKLNNS